VVDGPNLNNPRTILAAGFAPAKTGHTQRLSHDGSLKFNLENIL